jgi:hypothetical protein
MEELKPEVAGLFTAKEARRRKLRALPFPEKVRAVIRLQQMVAPILRARGKHVRVWTVDEAVPPDQSRQ